MRRSVRLQVFMIFCLTAVLPLIAVSVFSVIKIRESLTAEAYEWLDSIATIQKSRVADTLDEFERATELIATRTSMRRQVMLFNQGETDGHLLNLGKILSHVSEGSSTITQVSIANLKGQVIASTNREKMGADHSGESFFPMAQQKIVFVGFVPTLKRSIHIACPLKHEGQLVGVLSVYFDAEKLFDITKDYTGLGETGETFLTVRGEGDNAEALNTMRFSERLSIGAQEKLKFPISQGAFQEVEGRLSSAVTDYRDESVIAVARHLEKYQIGIVVKIDKKEIFKPINDFENMLFAVTALLLSIVVVITFYFTRPIVELARVAKDFAQGNLSSTSKVSGSSTELREVSRALNIAIEQTKISVADMQSKVDAATEALQDTFHQKAQLAAIVDSTSDAVISKDFDGTIRSWNDGAVKMFGYTAEEVIGKNIDILRCPDEKGSKNSLETIAAGGAVATFETKRIRKDGSEIDVSMTLSVMRDDDGKAIGVSSICRDISRRKSTERQLEQKHAEIEQFIYTVTHDLKSPIVTASSFLQFLTEDLEAGDTNRVQDSLRRLKGAISRMEVLNGQILSVSRAGQQKLEKETLNLSEIVRRSWEEIELQSKKKIEFVVKGELPEVVGDRGRIIRVFENLLSNAVKYGCEDSSGIIEVGAGESTRFEHLIYVRDYGRGIAEEYHKRIFGLFQRLETREEGTGVGLTIVARVMQAHGGRVWVESKVGEGTTFWLAFAINMEEDDEKFS